MEADVLAARLDEVTPPDLKEAFSIGPVDVPDDDYHRGPAAGNFFAPNFWPDTPPEMCEVWSTYYRAMEDLAQTLMRIFALGLDLPETWFDDKIDHHITNFSVLHYPDQENVPLPGQLRAGEHSDYGSLTILQKDDAPGGLQVRMAAARCAFTVPSLVPRRQAISLLASPSRTSAATCRWRGVSATSAGQGNTDRLAKLLPVARFRHEGRCAQHDQWRRRLLRPQGGNALELLHRRHAQVDDHQVQRIVATRQFERIGIVPGLDHVAVRQDQAQQVRDAFAEQGMVVGQQNSHRPSLL
jgi:hypothetical protein